MRAAVALGRESVECRELPVPEPGPGEVRVRVTACGLCGSDLHLYHLGAYAPQVVPGHEIAGRVDALGPGVAGFAPGDPVAVEPLRSCGACEWCRSGRSPLCPEGSLLGVALPGGFADYVVAEAQRLFRLPEGLDPRIAALSEPAAVAVHGLRRAGLEPGQRVLVLGAGSVGLMGVAAARHLGAGEVWVSARYAHQGERAARLGADRVLREDEATPDALYAWPLADRPHVVLETVGGAADTLQAAAAAVRPGGTVSVLGLFLAPLSLPGFPLFQKEVTLAWSNCYVRDGDRADFADAVALVAGRRRELAEVASHAVSLDDAPGAWSLAADKRAGVVKVSIVP